MRDCEKFKNCCETETNRTINNNNKKLNSFPHIYYEKYIHIFKKKKHSNLQKYNLKFQWKKKRISYFNCFASFSVKNWKMKKIKKRIWCIPPVFDETMRPTVRFIRETSKITCDKCKIEIDRSLTRYIDTDSDTCFAAPNGSNSAGTQALLYVQVNQTTYIPGNGNCVCAASCDSFQKWISVNGITIVVESNGLLRGTGGGKFPALCLTFVTRQ